MRRSAVDIGTGNWVVTANEILSCGIFSANIKSLLYILCLNSVFELRKSACLKGLPQLFGELAHWFYLSLWKYNQTPLLCLWQMSQSCVQSNVLVNSMLSTLGLRLM